MNPTLQKYYDLERKMLDLGQQNEGQDSLEEDALLDEMDRVWWQLSELERSEIDEARADNALFPGGSS